MSIEDSVQLDHPDPDLILRTKIAMNELESRLPFSVEPESVVFQLRLGVEKLGTILALQTRGTAVVDVVGWISFDGAEAVEVCRFAGMVDTVVTWVVKNNRTVRKLKVPWY